MIFIFKFHVDFRGYTPTKSPDLTAEDPNETLVGAAVAEALFLSKSGVDSVNDPGAPRIFADDGSLARMFSGMSFGGPQNHIPFCTLNNHGFWIDVLWETQDFMYWFGSPPIPINIYE